MARRGGGASGRAREVKAAEQERKEGRERERGKKTRFVSCPLFIHTTARAAAEKDAPQSHSGGDCVQQHCGDDSRTRPAAAPRRKERGRGEREREGKRKQKKPSTPTSAPFTVVLSPSPLSLSSSLGGGVLCDGLVAALVLLRRLDDAGLAQLGKLLDGVLELGRVLLVLVGDKLGQRRDKVDGARELAGHIHPVGRRRERRRHGRGRGGEAEAKEAQEREREEARKKGAGIRTRGDSG